MVGEGSTVCKGAPVLCFDEGGPSIVWSWGAGAVLCGWAGGQYCEVFLGCIRIFHHIRPRFPPSKFEIFVLSLEVHP